MVMTNSDHLIATPAACPENIAPLEFFFDFLSPFGYFASLRIDDIAARHGREVLWKPMLLGVSVLKVMGMKPIFDTPLKGAYIRHEALRFMRRHDITIARELVTPTMNPLPAARTFSWLQHHAPAYAKPFARCAFMTYWQRNRELLTAEVLGSVGVDAGVPPELIDNAIRDPEASRLLRHDVDGAIARGVFGSPFFMVDGEPFFGCDKLELIDEWLRCGGW